MKKPIYSAKPGQLVDYYGNRIVPYSGTIKKAKNLERYNSIEDSEKRRSEIKKQRFLSQFRNEIVETCKLMNQSEK